MKQLLRLRNLLLLKNCIDYAFFYCFLVKFTKINGILSNFELKNREKFKQLLRLRTFSGCLYKKKVYDEKPLKQPKIKRFNGIFQIIAGPPSIFLNALNRWKIPPAI